MRRHKQITRTGSLFFLAMVILATAAVGAQDPAEESLPRSAAEPATVTLVIRHRVAASFADTIEAVWGVGEQYWIGDTDYSLEVTRFVADFGINESGEIIERGDEPHNPACQVIIYNNDVEEDRSWAFFGSGAPHFRRNSILAVDLLSFPWRGSIQTEPTPRKDND